MNKKELEEILLEIKDDSLESRLIKGEILFRLGRLEEALNILRNIDLLEGLILKYKIFMKMNKIKDAESELQKAVEIYPYNHYVHFLLATLEEKLGNLDLALTEIDKGLEIMPISTTYLSLKTRILFKMGLYENVLQTSAEVIKNKPDDLKVRMMRILSYYFLGSRYNALMEVNKALEYSKDHYLHFLKGKIYYELGYYNLALDEFKIAIHIREKPEYFYYVSLVLYLSKKYTEALTFIDKALENESKNQYYLALKAKILWELKDKNAKGVAYEAIRIDKSLSSILKDILD
jgi:tetratricopeptide (TPR) repeat protein